MRTAFPASSPAADSWYFERCGQYRYRLTDVHFNGIASARSADRVAPDLTDTALNTVDRNR